MPGGQAFQNFLPDRLLANAVKEILDDLKVDVRLKQREADFLQRLSNIVFGEHTLPTKLLEDSFELFTQRIKHESPNKKAIEAGVEPELRSPGKTSQKIASGSL